MTRGRWEAALLMRTAVLVWVLVLVQARVMARALLVDGWWSRVRVRMSARTSERASERVMRNGMDSLSALNSSQELDPDRGYGS